MTKPLLTTAAANLLSRLTKLRASAMAIDVNIGAKFTRESAAGFRTDSWTGLAGACSALQLALSEVPGAWDTFVAARDLAHDCTLQAGDVS